MGGISAVLLTVGENSTARARASIEAQSLPAERIVTVDETISPFWRALQHGASQVETEFFVQVDADMVLDSGCFEALHSLMGPEIGIVSAKLRDPLLGRVSAVKMYRTAPFLDVELAGGFSPEIELLTILAARRWWHLSGLWYGPGEKEKWHTLGEHRAEYAPDYAFSKLRVEGRRQRTRERPWALWLWARRLRESTHPLAAMAEIALLDGYFREETGDFRQPYPPDPDFERFMAFLASDGKPPDTAVLPPASEAASAAEAFRGYHRYGSLLQANGAAPAFMATLETLAQSDDPNAMIARVALCRGLFVEPWSAASCARDWAMARVLVVEGPCPS